MSAAEADRLIAQLAARQHGVVSRRQLLRAGISSAVIEHRVMTGRLHGLHRGVYLVGPLYAPHTREMAALLACGEHAALCARTAAVVWRIEPHGGDGSALEILVTHGHPCGRTGIRVHRMRSVRTDEITVHDGLRITTPARTLLDLAAAAEPGEIERAVAGAIYERLATVPQLVTLAGLHPCLPGARRLRAVLDEARPPTLTRSEAEGRFLDLVRRARLDPPLTNTGVEGFEVDFLWPDHRLVVEVDGRAFHSSPRDFERDRRRDARLIAAGLSVMRVTWKQIVSEPEALLVQLARALTRRDGRSAASRVR